MTTRGREQPTRYYALRDQGYSHSEAVELLKAERGGVRFRGAAGDDFLLGRRIQQALRTRWRQDNPEVEA